MNDSDWILKEPLPKVPKCKKCNRERHNHKAGPQLNCPFGSRTRVGYVGFYPNQFYEPKKTREKKK